MQTMHHPLMFSLVLAFLATAGNPVAAQGAPVVQFSAAPASGQAPLTVQFTNDTTGSVDAWSWSFGDSGTSTLAEPEHTYTEAGSYTVVLAAVGPGGVDGELKDNYIIVTVPSSSAEFSGSPTTGPYPLNVQFTDESTGYLNGWLWTFGDGGTSTQQHPQHTYEGPGSFQVTLRVVGPTGPDKEIKFGYIQVGFPPPVADFTATPVTGGSPLTVQFTDTSSNQPTTWFWSFGDSSSSTLQNPQHTFTTGITNSFTVLLLVTNSGGTGVKTKGAFINLLPSGFSDLGQGLAGAGGTPQLVGTGTLTANSQVSLELSDALPASIAVLVYGASIANTPFRGGILVPSADLAFAGLPTGPLGQISLPTVWPPGVPAGVESIFQYWIIDPSGPLGFTASNAVIAITP